MAWWACAALVPFKVICLTIWKQRGNVSQARYGAGWYVFLAGCVFGEFHSIRPDEYWMQY